jgi:site-specific recombinase XerD
MSQPTLLDQSINLDDYISVWVDAFITAKIQENRSPKTIRFYTIYLTEFSQYCDNHSIKLIHQITSQFLREYLLSLEQSGHNVGGQLVYFRSIKAFLNWFWEEMEPEYRNPIHKVKPPKNPLEPLTGITRDEFDALVAVCPKHTFLGVRDACIMMVLYDTGVRAQELCDIRIEDISLVQKWVFIPKGKGSKPRMVFFGSQTRKMLRKYLKIRRNDEFLFANQSGEKIEYVALRQIIRRLCEQANIKGISLHDFRRGFTLVCLNKGMAETTIARLLGHASTALIPRYAKQTTVDLQNAYQSVVDE